MKENELVVFDEEIKTPKVLAKKISLNKCMSIPRHSIVYYHTPDENIVINKNFIAIEKKYVIG